MAFFKSLICFIALFGTIALAQYRQYQPLVRLVRASQQQNAPAAPDQQAQIVQAANEYNPNDGSFSYGFQSNNGISEQAKGYQNPNGKQVIEGSYSFYSKEGTPVSISYIADENGFQASGDAIPQPDANIIRAVAYLRSLPSNPEDDKQ